MREIYEHFAKYGIVKKELVDKRLAQLSDEKLTELLQSYLEMARKRPLVYRAKPSALDIYPDSWSAPLPLPIIKQLAIYAGRIYIHDPIIPLALDWPAMDFIHPYTIQYPSHAEKAEYFRTTLAETIKELMDLLPLVEARVVHVVPTDLVIPRKDPRAAYADDLYGPQGSFPRLTGEEEQEIPPSLKIFFDDRIRVLPATYINKEQTILWNQQLSPRNMIAVFFEDDPIAHYYHLFNVSAVDGEEGRVMMFFSPEGKQEVDPDTFRNWVEGEKLKTALERFHRLHNDLVTAAMARARFITSLPTSRDMALLNPSARSDDAGTKAVTALLNLELPFFEKVDLVAIAKARQDELSFEEFRAALDKAFKEIEGLPGSTRFQEQVDEISRDLLLLPVKRIEQRMTTLRRNVFIDVGLSVGSLGATLITQGNTLISAAAIIAATKAFEMYRKHKAEEDELRQLPGFFYWKLAEKNK